VLKSRVVLRRLENIRIWPVRCQVLAKPHPIHFRPPGPSGFGETVEINRRHVSSRHSRPCICPKTLSGPNKAMSKIKWTAEETGTALVVLMECGW